MKFGNVFLDEDVDKVVVVKDAVGDEGVKGRPFLKTDGDELGFFFLDSQFPDFCSNEVFDGLHLPDFPTPLDLEDLSQFVSNDEGVLVCGISFGPGEEFEDGPVPSLGLDGGTDHSSKEALNKTENRLNLFQKLKILIQ